MQPDAGRELEAAAQHAREEQAAEAAALEGGDEPEVRELDVRSAAGAAPGSVPATSSA